jgi:hypothetical protein
VGQAASQNPGNPAFPSVGVNGSWNVVLVELSHGMIWKKGRNSKMIRFAVVVFMLLLAVVIAGDVLAQNLVISVRDMDTIAREVKSFTGTPIINLQSQNPQACIFYGYGKAADGQGFYRYYEPTSLTSYDARAQTMMKIQNKLMGYGAMDVRIYEIQPGRYAELRP